MNRFTVITTIFLSGVLTGGCGGGGSGSDEVNPSNNTDEAQQNNNKIINAFSAGFPAHLTTELNVPGTTALYEINDQPVNLYYKGSDGSIETLTFLQHPLFMNFLVTDLDDKPLADELVEITANKGEITNEGSITGDFHPVDITSEKTATATSNEFGDIAFFVKPVEVGEYEIKGIIDNSSAKITFRASTGIPSGIGIQLSTDELRGDTDFLVVVNMIDRYGYAPGVPQSVQFDISGGTVKENDHNCDSKGECIYNFTLLNGDEISIKAFIYGEEPFIDENENLMHDEGEPFTDLNNDGVWNGPCVGEKSIDDCELLTPIYSETKTITVVF